MVSHKDKQLMLGGAGAILALGLIFTISTWVMNQNALTDVKRYAKAHKWKYKVDPTTGNVLCGSNAKQIPLENLKTYTICGVTFKSQEKLGLKVFKANKVMEAEYAKYMKEKEALRARQKKAGLAKKIALEAAFDWKWKGYLARKGIAVTTHFGDSDVMKCIRVDSGFRPTAEQYRIYMDSLTEEGKKLWKEGKPIGSKHQTYTAAPPCRSFHETGRAIDVSNWDAAGHYLWAQGLHGGSRGLYKDPYHFSKGELTNQGAIRANANRVWYIKCKKLKRKCGG